MKLCLSAGSLHNHPLEEVAALAADVGFDGLEVIVGDRFATPLAEGARLLQQVAVVLPVTSLHAPLFELNNWGNAQNHVRRTVGLAEQAGVPLVTFHPPSWLALEWVFWRWMYRIGDFQRDLGSAGQVTVTLENMPRSGPFGLPPYVLSHPPRLLRFLEKHNLFLTFDTAHMGSLTVDILPAFVRFQQRDRVRSIHLSDYSFGREHLVPGHGQLPITRFLHHLQQSGYAHGVVLELMPQELPDTLPGCRGMLRQLQERLRGELELTG